MFRKVMEENSFEFDYEFDWVTKKNQKRKQAKKEQENVPKKLPIAAQPAGDTGPVLSERKNKPVDVKRSVAVRKSQRHPLLSNRRKYVNNSRAYKTKTTK